MNIIIQYSLKDPLIYYFDMLGERFAMRQARAWITFALVKPSDLTGGVSARSCNLILEDRLTYWNIIGKNEGMVEAQKRFSVLTV